MVEVLLGVLLGVPRGRRAPPTHLLWCYRCSYRQLHANIKIHRYKKNVLILLKTTSVELFLVKNFFVLQLQRGSHPQDLFPLVMINLFLRFCNFPLCESFLSLAFFHHFPFVLLK